MANAGWDLEMELLCVPATGGSVRQMQKIASKIANACEEVPQHVSELANLPNDSHRERALHRWVNRQPWRALLPEPYLFEIPYTADGIRVTTKEHAAFLPHEMFSSLSCVPELFEELLIGPPGALENFWDKTSSTEWFQRHPVQELRHSPRLVVPCGMHGDDAGVFQTEKVLVLTWGSVVRELLTLDSRLLFSAVTYRHAVLNSSIDELYAIFAWSMNVLACGEFPACDHRGVPFSPDYHPQRFRMAGTKLTQSGHIGVWSELRGDWKFQVEALSLKATYNHNDICHLCRAHKVRNRFLYTKFKRDAFIRRTLISSSRFRDAYEGARPSITRIVGFDIWRCWVDAMHCLDLGVYQGVAGSCLLELVDEGMWDGRNVEHKLFEAHVEYKDWCKPLGLPPCPRFSKNKLQMTRTDFPAFTQRQAKASQTRYLIRWLGSVCIRAATTPYGRLRLLMFRNWISFEDTCDMNDRWLPQEDREDIAQCIESALVCMNALHVRNMEQGKYMYQLLPKCHMATHMAYDIAATGINPRRTTCYADEDMVGKVKAIMLKCHGSSAGKRCMDRYAIMVGTRWWQRLAELRGLRADANVQA